LRADQAGFHLAAQLASALRAYSQLSLEDAEAGLQPRLRLESLRGPSRLDVQALAKLLQVAPLQREPKPFEGRVQDAVSRRHQHIGVGHVLEREQSVGVDGHGEDVCILQDLGQAVQLRGLPAARMADEDLTDEALAGPVDAAEQPIQCAHAPAGSR